MGETVASLTKKLAEAESQVNIRDKEIRDWKLESARFRTKWLDAERLHNEVVGQLTATAAHLQEIRGWFKSMLAVNWALWALNLVMLVLWALR